MKLTTSAIYSFLTALVIGFASCSKQSTPVTMFASEINEITNQINAAKTYEDLFNATSNLQDSEATQIIIDNPDYVLSDEDRQIIKDALIEFFMANLEKNHEFAGMELTEERKAQVLKLIEPGLDRIKTLADLLDIAPRKSDIQNEASNGNEVQTDSIAE